MRESFNFCGEKVFNCGEVSQMMPFNSWIIKVLIALRKKNRYIKFEAIKKKNQTFNFDIKSNYPNILSAIFVSNFGSCSPTMSLQNYNNNKLIVITYHL